MRQLFERLDSGLASTQHTGITQETQTTSQTQEGGFDDIFPSDYVTVFDKEDDYEETERTYTTSVMEEDTESYDTVDVVIREVATGVSAVAAPGEVPKKKKKKSSRRSSTDANKSTAKSIPLGGKHHHTDASPRKLRPRKAQLEKAKSERATLTAPDSPRRSTANLPSPRTTKLTVSKDASDKTSKAMQMIMDAMERNRRCDSLGKQRCNSAGRQLQSNKKSNSQRKGMKSSPAKRRPSLGSSMDRCKSSHTTTTVSSSSHSSNDQYVAKQTQRRADAPLRPRCPESPTKRNSPYEEATSPTPRSPRRHASPFQKSKMVHMFPISPRRSSLQPEQVELVKNKKHDGDILFVPPPLTPQQPLGNFFSGNESDSRIRYSHHISSDATVADEVMSTTTSQFVGRRTRSRHPKRHTAVLDPQRRVAPQRSRSLTDMRDMLRPKSDPRHKPRASSNQKERLNPLDAFFTSQVVVPPSAKDSRRVTDTTLEGLTAKRPLARRLVRHNEALAHCKLDESLHAISMHQTANATTDSKTRERRRMAPQRSRSLTDMREMARNPFFKKDDSPSVVEFQKPTEWKTYYASVKLSV